MTLTISIVLGYCLDMLFGDPLGMMHPVIFIGKWITAAEKQIRFIFPKTARGELAGGFVLAVLTVGISFCIPLLALFLLMKIHAVLAFTLETFWIYQILAAKCLKTESMKVYHALKEKDLPKARQELSCLVGRDTQNLTEEEVIKAAVETVSENTTDGVTAPLFYILLGGAPLGFLYKAINTLDSMVGYKSKKYLYFGRISAYLDDIANFIPARITAFIMVVSVYFLRLDAKSAFATFLRDRNHHLSPNSAQTESVAAGALGIQLGGTHDYFGKPVEKPTIGEKKRSAEYEDIKRTNDMMYLTGFFALLICVVMGLAVR